VSQDPRSHFSLSCLPFLAAFASRFRLALHHDAKAATLRGPQKFQFVTQAAPTPRTGWRLGHALQRRQQRDSRLMTWQNRTAETFATDQRYLYYQLSVKGARQVAETASEALVWRLVLYTCRLIQALPAAACPVWLCCCRCRTQGLRGMRHPHR
jgi:hypothetical protein